jgi:hypothetical protein
MVLRTTQRLLLRVLLDEVAEAEHDAGAYQRCRRGPFREGGGCRADRGIDIVTRAENDFAGDRTIRRLVDFRAARKRRMSACPR